MPTRSADKTTTRPGVGTSFNAREHRTAQKQKFSDGPRFPRSVNSAVWSSANFQWRAISRWVQMMGIIVHDVDITSARG